LDISYTKVNSLDPNPVEARKSLQLKIPKGKSMKIRLKPILYPVLVVGVGIAISSFMMANRSSSLAFAEGTVEVDPLADAPTVATITPALASYAPQLQLYSQLQSGQQILVNSPAAAEVLSVNVFEGDEVAAGDVLVTLDTSSLNRQVQQLKARRMDLAARRSAEAEQYKSNVAALEVEQQLVNIAQRSVDRLSDLSNQRLTSAAEIENAERTLQNQRLSLQNRELAISRHALVDQQYKAQLLDIDSQIEQAEDQFADATVTAPFAAKISQVQVQVGASLVSGQNLMTLVDPGQQELVAWVSANSLEQTADLKQLKGNLEAGKQLLPVTLTHADPSANAGSLRLFFETEQAVNSLVLNRYYRMWVDLPVQQAYAVPESSVYSNQFVYSIQDTRLQRIQVEVLGERFEDGQLWRLVRGPLSGESLLVTRLQNAAQGLAVRSAAASNSLAAAGN
jgi:multidrug efflux pump subunit AcrA (membrane-fusion protein)